MTAKSTDQQPIFKDKADTKAYLDLVKKYKEQHHFKLFSFNLLSDRLHLLIETGEDATISEIMHDLNSLYTKYFNGRYERHGHLFESRFKSVLVEKATHLLKMTRFIHTEISSPNDPCSSFLIYKASQNPSTELPLELKEIDLKAEINEVLEFLIDKDHGAYERYCLEGDAEEMKSLEKSLRRASILGSPYFMAQAKNRIARYIPPQKEEVLKVRSFAKRNKSLLIMAGTAALLATGSSVYLYVSRQNLQTHFETVLQRREKEFKEKIRFENRSPIALTELEGTQWQMEMIALPTVEGEEPFKDMISFKNGSVSSEYFNARGFNSTPITTQTQDNGVVVWQTVQLNMNGDRLSWRGLWSGDAMKGVVSFHAVGQKPKNISFYSVEWSYADGTHGTR